MIPFSILSGQLLAEGNSVQEISILDVSRIGFPFRVPKSFHKSWDAIRLQFYCRKNSAYREVVLRDVFCEMQQETEFFVVYRVETNQPDYKAAVTHWRRHGRAIRHRWMMYLRRIGTRSGTTGFPVCSRMALGAPAYPSCRRWRLLWIGQSCGKNISHCRTRSFLHGIGRCTDWANIRFHACRCGMCMSAARTVRACFRSRKRCAGLCTRRGARTCSRYW